MFLIPITYTQPLEAVDAFLVEHREYLKRNYAAGVFLLSGRKEPVDGGVILARASSAADLQAIIATDPFKVHGVAAYQIVEFNPTMAAPGLESLVVA